MPDCWHQDSSHCDVSSAASGLHLRLLSAIMAGSALAGFLLLILVRCTVCDCMLMLI